MAYSEIYTLTPINKTAALVTNQSGCVDETAFVTVSREVENLTLCIQATEKRLLETDSPIEKKELGQWKCELQKQMRPLREKKKALNVQHQSSINSLLIRECIKRFTREEWVEIENIAKRKYANQGN